MKVLPPELKPASEPIEHRHRSRPVRGARGFMAFRPCLRWDFGFTCAFCLLHEADFSLAVGARGAGQMSIEHYISWSVEPSKRNQYSNCLYACMRCNIARSDNPVVDDIGRRLLDPSRDAWADHFIVADCRIRPREGDADAEYTGDTYDLNAPDKVARRLFRRDLWASRRQLIAETPEQIDTLMREAETYLKTDRKRFFEFTTIAGSLDQALRNAREELSWFSAIPPDAPSSCRCGNTAYHSLPPWLARQVMDLPQSRISGESAFEVGSVD